MDRSIEKFKRTGDFQCSVRIDPKGQPWQMREKETLNEIRSLYKQRLPDLSDRKVISNMAILVAATGFWTDRKRIETRAQNRIDKATTVAEKVRLGAQFENAKLNRIRIYNDRLRKQFQKTDREEIRCRQRDLT